MPTEVVMPEIGETVVSGTIVQWLKEVGDTIELDEPLVEIATDKANVEIPAPAAGVLQKKLAEEGDEVEVGGLLAIIAGEDEKLEEETATEEEPEELLKTDKDTEKDEEEAEATQKPEKEEKKPPRPSAEKTSKPEKPAPEKAEKAVARRPTEKADDAETVAERRRTRSSPLVRRMAREHDIDISQIEGSGADGRVTKDDLLDYIAAREKKEPSPKAAAREKAPVKARAERPLDELEEAIPLEGMRKAIAEHMVRSKRTSPHVTTIAEADMSAVTDIRGRHKEAFQHKYGTALTYLPFFIAATVQALKEFPYLNSSMEGDKIILKRYYNIGVSVQTERGLMTPVIRDADTLDIEGLARALDSLARRAREGRLSLKEIQGGTFSITSPGTYGAILSTPIINQPHAAILGVERIQKRAVVIDDAIAIRPMVYLCLSYDHRIVDGATSIQFLQRVRELLEAGDFPIDTCP
jgi:2-oxoglutarate dehydrogenase E2 component (dihydrolipoamide succinyltransferase)